MPARVLAQHNDVGRSGANLEETTLNTSNVNVNQCLHHLDALSVFHRQ